MAITFTQLAAGSADTSQATSYAGTAGTPAAGELLIAFVTASGTIAGGSMTGGGLTWTKLTSFTKNAGADTQYIFWAIATSASSITPTFDCTGDQATGACVYVLRVTGDSAYLRPYIRQFATNSASTANPSVTMARAILTGSGVCGMCANTTNSSTQFTAPTNWTENSEVTYATPSTAMQVSSRASGETGTTITWTNANTTAWGAIVLEIAVDGSVDFSENNSESSTKALGIKRKGAAHEGDLNLLGTTLGPPDPNTPRQHQLYGKLKKKKKDQEQEPNNTLTNTLAPTAQVNPFTAPEEYIKGTKPKTKQQAEIQNLLGTLLGVTAAQSPFSLPDVGGLKKTAKRQLQDIPNLLGTTLAPTGAPPTIQPRIHNIVRKLKKKLIKWEDQYPNLTVSTLSSVTPGNPFFTKEEIAKLRKKADVKFTADLTNLLLSTLFVPPTVTPFKVHPDEKLPKRKIKPSADEFNLLTSTLGPKFCQRIPITLAKLKKRLGLGAEEPINLLTGPLGPAPAAPKAIKEETIRLTKRGTKVNQEGANLPILGVPQTVTVPRKHSIPPQVKKRIKPQAQETPNTLATLLSGPPPTEVIVPRMRSLTPPVKKRKTKQEEEYQNLSLLPIPEYVTRVALIQSRGKKRAGLGSEDIRNLLTSTLGGTPAAPPTTKEDRIRLNKRGAIVNQEGANLPITTLGLPVGVPFFTREQLDRFLLKRKANLSFDQANQLTSGLGPVPAPPFVVKEEGVKGNKRTTKPTLDIPNPQALLGQVQVSPFVLQENVIRQTKARVKFTLEEVNLLATTLAQVSVPFITQEAALILVKARRKQAPEDINLLTSVLTPTSQPFFTQEVAPKLGRARIKVSEDIPSTSLLSQSLPFATQESILKIIRARNRQVVEGSNLITGTLGLPIIPPPPIKEGTREWKRRIALQSYDVIGSLLPLKVAMTTGKNPRKIFNSRKRDRFYSKKQDIFYP